MIYQSERHLVVEALQHLSRPAHPLGALQLATEFDYQRGRTDIVGHCSQTADVLAFEAKLTRWRDALHQAYRNICFAHRSYVIVPADIAHRVLPHEHAFRRRSVGLLISSPLCLELKIPARRQSPLQDWLNHEAMTYATAASA